MQEIQVIDWNMVLNMVMLTIIIVGMILLHNSVPAAKVDKLLDQLDKSASSTPDKIDDMAVTIASVVWSLLKGQVNTDEAASTDRILASSAHSLHTRKAVPKAPDLAQPSETPPDEDDGPHA